MVQYGPVWFFMVPYGSLWSHRVLYGPVWSLLVLYISDLSGTVHYARTPDIVTRFPSRPLISPFRADHPTRLPCAPANLPETRANTLFGESVPPLKLGSVLYYYYYKEVNNAHVQERLHAFLDLQAIILEAGAHLYFGDVETLCFPLPLSPSFMFRCCVFLSLARRIDQLPR